MTKQTKYPLLISGFINNTLQVLNSHILDNKNKLSLFKINSWPRLMNIYKWLDSKSLASEQINFQFPTSIRPPHRNCELIKTTLILFVYNMG
jgi:hypothetical protein